MYLSSVFTHRISGFCLKSRRGLKACWSGLQTRAGLILLMLYLALSSTQLVFGGNTAGPLASSGLVDAHALIRPDGTLNTTTGFVGSLDLKGWHVVLDPQRGPLFTASTPNTWNAIDQGLSGAVQALAVIGTDLYVGGTFTAVGTGGTTVTGLNNIAKWNGSAWSALGTGLNNQIKSIAVMGNSLYVGGLFTDIGTGGISVAGLNRVAKWDGTAWSALDKGLGTTTIYVLAVMGTDVYVGGSFTAVGTGGTAVAGLNRIAKWNGSTWSALDMGFNNAVRTLTAVGTDLYAGGFFTAVGTGGKAVPGIETIAKWDGSSWSAFDKGVNSQVYAIAKIGTNLYIGGNFTDTGAGSTSVPGLNYIAQWIPCSLTVSMAATPSLTITQGNSTTLTASGATSYMWSTGETTASISATASGMYSVTGVTGTCSATASAAVSVNSAPELLGYIDNNQDYMCAGGTADFSANIPQGTPPYSYTWIAPPLATFNATSLSAVTVTADPTATGTLSFTLLVSDASHQSLTAVTDLKVNPAPTVSISASPSFTVTQGQSATLTASGADTYLWSRGETTASISATAAGTYSVTGTSSAGCSATTSAVVSVTSSNPTGPDLTATLTLPDNNFPNSAGSYKDFVMNLYEVGGVATSAGTITITLTAPVGYTLAFDGGATSVAVSGGSQTTVNNGDWLPTLSQDGQQLSLTIKAGHNIAANSQSIVGFRVVRTTANSGSASNLTVNVSDDSSYTYDVNSANNIYARVLNGL